MEVKIHSYKDLIVWQKAMNLVTTVYEITQRFPQSELYILTSQMKRSAISIPSNIAEGRRRKSRKEYSQFLNIAYASGAELETQLEIAKRLNFCQDSFFKKTRDLLMEVMKMLNKMTSSLKPTT